MLSNSVFILLQEDLGIEIRAGPAEEEWERERREARALRERMTQGQSEAKEKEAPMWKKLMTGERVMEDKPKAKPLAAGEDRFTFGIRLNQRSDPLRSEDGRLARFVWDSPPLQEGECVSSRVCLQRTVGWEQQYQYQSFGA